MDPVREVEGRAIPFGRKNVDTDLIIPARWLKTVTREGLGRGAFESLREDPDNVFDAALDIAALLQREDLLPQIPPDPSSAP